MASLQGNRVSHDFEQLNPDFILDAVESTGLLCNYRILELNSYENRVFQVGLEDNSFVVAKFYRPGRWSREQIEEELAFCDELYAHEIPAVPPMMFHGQHLAEYPPFFFTLCPRRGGRHAEMDNLDHLFRIGQYLARIHTVGESKPFVHRPTLNTHNFGRLSSQFLLENDWIPPHLQMRYTRITDELMRLCDAQFDLIKPDNIRLHGDCHPGNILWTENGPHFVDFDDARMGPAIQDLWMMLSGEQHEVQQQVDEILAGYEEFRAFNRAELRLVEPLRSLRMIHYAAWLARRWTDPAFPKAFPWFGSEKYWEEHLMSLEQQASLIEHRDAAYYTY